MKRLFGGLMILAFVSACSKVETMPYDCEHAPKPQLTDTVYNVAFGSIITNSSSQFNSYWVGPEGYSATGNSVNILLNSVQSFGIYRAYYFTESCVSDSAIFTVNMTGSVSPPCSPTMNSYNVNGVNYGTSFFSEEVYEFDNKYTVRWHASSGFQDVFLNAEIYGIEKPQIGKVYFIDSTYTLPLENRIAINGYDQNIGNNWNAKNGAVYCTEGSDSTHFNLTFCNVTAVMNNGQYTTLTGRVYY